MKQRIWELDVLRGIFILGMVVVHLIYDLQTFLHIPFLADSKLYDFIADWGGVLFFLISGICVTLGSHPLRRGLVVVGCGLVVSAVTFGMYYFDFAGKSMIIYFGVLHCLGVCMLLWPIFKKIPWPVLLPIAALLVYIGLELEPYRFPTGLWLVPLGLRPIAFASSDYFPLLPFLGFFLVGAVLGKTLYKNKASLLPTVSDKNFLVRSFSLLGRWSLPIYMLHQPLITGVIVLLEVVL